MDNANEKNTSQDSSSNQGATEKSSPSNNVVMGILAYLGPLVIISYLVARDNPFVKFHIKQGLVLFVLEIAVWILGGIFWPLWIVFRLVDLIVFILAIIGIINVVNGKEKDLPIIGKYSKYFSF